MIDFDSQIQQAVQTLKNGGIIAYPTEAVYGFGCDPFNPDAISKILQIKERSYDKGFILVASNWSQLEPLIEPIQPRMMAQVHETWPGPVTWIFPADPSVPNWITGNRKTIAVRISAHPVVQAICQSFGKPIISTSANVQGNPAIRDCRTVKMAFGSLVDFIFEGQVGKLRLPTEIRNAVTGEIVRVSDKTLKGEKT